MRYLKKVIPLKDARTSPVGSATAVFKDGAWQVDVLLADKNFKGDFTSFLWCNEFKKFDGLSFGFQGAEGEMSLAVFQDEKLIAFGKTLSSAVSLGRIKEYVKSQKAAEGTDNAADSQAEYNDFAIATENYYEGVLESELSKDHGNAERQAKGGEGSQEKDGGDVLSQYEEDEGFSGGYKKEERKRAPDHARSRVLGEDQREYFEEKRQEFLKLFLENEKDSSLKGVIPNGKFVKIKDDKSERFYLLGLVGKEFSSPDYILYAVPGERGIKSEGFESAAFIPTDLFDGKRGYYVSFQSPKTGKKITSLGFLC